MYRINSSYDLDYNPEKYYVNNVFDINCCSIKLKPKFFCISSIYLYPINSSYDLDYNPEKDKEKARADERSRKLKMKQKLKGMFLFWTLSSLQMT